MDFDIYVTTSVVKVIPTGRKTAPLCSQVCSHKLRGAGDDLRPPHYDICDLSKMMNCIQYWLEVNEGRTEN